MKMWEFIHFIVIDKNQGIKKIGSRSERRRKAKLVSVER